MQKARYQPLKALLYYTKFAFCIIMCIKLGVEKKVGDGATLQV